jgi:hypothetical protein
MKTWVGRLVTFGLVVGLGAFTGPGLGTTKGADDPLAAGFEKPPNEAKPRVWWHWMNGTSRRKIRLDSRCTASASRFQNFDASPSRTRSWTAAFTCRRRKDLLDATTLPISSPGRRSRRQGGASRAGL